LGLGASLGATTPQDDPFGYAPFGSAQDRQGKWDKSTPHVRLRQGYAGQVDPTKKGPSESLTSVVGLPPWRLQR